MDSLHQRDLGQGCVPFSWVQLAGFLLDWTSYLILIYRVLRYAWRWGYCGTTEGEGKGSLKLKLPFRFFSIFYAISQQSNKTTVKLGCSVVIFKTLLVYSIGKDAPGSFRIRCRVKPPKWIRFTWGLHGKLLAYACAMYAKA